MHRWVEPPGGLGGLALPCLRPLLFLPFLCFFFASTTSAATIAPAARAAPPIRLRKASRRVTRVTVSRLIKLSNRSPSIDVYPPSDGCRIHVVDTTSRCVELLRSSFTPSALPGENSDRDDPIQVLSKATCQAITATSLDVDRPHDDLPESPQAFRQARRARELPVSYDWSGEKLTGRHPKDGMI